MTFVLSTHLTRSFQIFTLSSSFESLSKNLPFFSRAPLPLPFRLSLLFQLKKHSPFHFSATLLFSPAMVSADAADWSAGATAADWSAGATSAVPCDFCATAPAVVFCRADTARLCLACDREVHAANTVSTRHHRSLLCDSCAAAPATIFCPSPPHRLVLCSNCDFDVHRADDGPHERRAVEPFFGCPAGVDLVAALYVGDLKGAVAWEEEEDWAWECPPVFSWDDLILSPTATPFHGYQTMGIPPPPKDRNSSCGKRKEEIHRQICKLIQEETDEADYNETEPVMEFISVPLENFQQGKVESKYDYNPVFVEVPSCEVSKVQWNHNGHQEAVSNQVESSYEQPIGSSSLATATFIVGTMEAALSASLPAGSDIDQANLSVKRNMSLMPQKEALEVPDRSFVISRYKEKRKTRRYDKHIRYETRKARADSRVRIKGRFAKADEVAKP